MIKVFDSRGNFIFKPQLCSDTDNFPWDNPKFVFEKKIDGVRCLLVSGSSAAAGAEAYSRSCNKISGSRVPKIWLPENTLVDSELASGTIYAFDLPMLLGEDLTDLELDSRYDLLTTLVKGLDNPKIQMAPRIKSSYDEAQRLILEGAEGVVAKRRNGPYRPSQRHLDWVRYKAVIDLDVIVTGLTPSSTAGYSNLAFSAYAGGVLKEIGHVKYSQPVSENQKLLGKVIQVRCNKIFESGRVRHPRVIRLRPDKLPEECIIY